jgi:hypothetical protein
MHPRRWCACDVRPAQIRVRNAEVVVLAGGDESATVDGAADGAADVTVKDAAAQTLDNSQMSRVYSLVTQALAKPDRRHQRPHLPWRCCAASLQRQIQPLPLRSAPARRLRWSRSARGTPNAAAAAGSACRAGRWSRPPPPGSARRSRS